MTTTRNIAVFIAAIIAAAFMIAAVIYMVHQPLSHLHLN